MFPAEIRGHKVATPLDETRAGALHRLNGQWRRSVRNNTAGETRHHADLSLLSFFFRPFSDDEEFWSP